MKTIDFKTFNDRLGIPQLTEFVPRIDLHNQGYAIRFISGAYKGSIAKIVAVKLSRGYRFTLSTVQEIESFKFEWEDNKFNSIHTVYGFPQTFKGSSIGFVENYFGKTKIKINENFKVYDCFGTVYESGKIVSYKRESKQIFSIVENINSVGRIKLRRIYNETTSQNYDYINPGHAHEYLIIDDKLVENLMLMRLKST